MLAVCLIALVNGLAVYEDPEDPEAYDEDIPEPKRDPWANGFDDRFTFTCPRNQGMIRVRSKHNSWYEDRLFDFDCERNSAITTSCTWSTYKNSMREKLDYTVPDGNVITGIESYHQNGKEDREFKFQYCKVSGSLDHCHESGYVNNYDKELSYGSSSKFIVGWKSVFSGWHRDRKFGFYTCEITGHSAIGK